MMGFAFIYKAIFSFFKKTGILCFSFLKKLFKKLCLLKKVGKKDLVYSYRKKQKVYQNQKKVMAKGKIFFQKSLKVLKSILLFFLKRAKKVSQILVSNVSFILKLSHKTTKLVYEIEKDKTHIYAQKNKKNFKKVFKNSTALLKEAKKLIKTQYLKQEKKLAHQIINYAFYFLGSFAFFLLFFFFALTAKLFLKAQKNIVKALNTLKKWVRRLLKIGYKFEKLLNPALFILKKVSSPFRFLYLSLNQAQWGFKLILRAKNKILLTGYRLKKQGAIFFFYLLKKIKLAYYFISSQFHFLKKYLMQKNDSLLLQYSKKAIAFFTFQFKKLKKRVIRLKNLSYFLISFLKKTAFRFFYLILFIFRFLNPLFFLNKIFIQFLLFFKTRLKKKFLKITQRIAFFKKPLKLAEKHIQKSTQNITTLKKFKNKKFLSFCASQLLFYQFINKKRTRVNFFNFKLIKKLLLFNWLKTGYALSIFLVLSLTAYSLDRWSLHQLEQSAPPPFIMKPIIALDLQDTNHINQLKENYQDQVVFTSTLQESHATISHNFNKESLILQLEGSAFVVGPNNPLKNLTQEQAQKLLSGKLTNWKELLNIDQPIEFLLDEESFYQFQEPTQTLSGKQITQELLKNPHALALVAIKNLNLNIKPLMINHQHPSRYALLQKKYPLGFFTALLIETQEQSMKEEILKIFKPTALDSIVAGGDIIWDRGVGRKIENTSINFIIKDLIPLFETGSLSVANLENPISERGSPYNLDKGIFFRANPKYRNLLTKLKLNLVSLSNNHMFDYGMTAALDTLTHLKELGIYYTGFGLDREEALKGEILELGGKKIRFLGYNSIYPFNVNVVQNIPGILMIKEATLQQEIQEAKKGVEKLILLVHDGEEYNIYPEDSKIQLYRKMIDYGADMIIGAHPHVIQSFEIYQGKPIIYSLGNLIFDQYRFPITRDELVMELLYYEGDLIACFPHFFKVNAHFQPKKSPDEEIEDLILRMERLKK